MTILRFYVIIDNGLDYDHDDKPLEVEKSSKNFDFPGFHVALISGGAAEPPPADPIYRHPSSPNYGAHWTRDTVVFDNIRLSNKISSSSASDKKIGLNSLHQYEPRDVLLSRN